MRHILMLTIAGAALLAQACAADRPPPSYNAPTTMPNPEPAVNAAQGIATNAADRLEVIAHEQAAAADAIDDSGGPELEPHTRSIRHNAGEVASIADKLRGAAVKLTEARTTITELRREVHRAISAALQFQTFAAKETQRANTAEEQRDSRLSFWLELGAAACWVIATASLIAGLIVFHNPKLALAIFLIFAAAGGILGAFARWAGPIMFASLAGVVLTIVVLVIVGLKRGWFTDPKAIGAAKLFIEGKTEEAVAALRQLPTLASAWIHAKRKAPAKPKEAA